MPPPEQVFSRPQRNDLFRALEESGALVSAFRLQAFQADKRGLFIHHDSSNSFIRIDHLVDRFAIYGTLGNGDPALASNLFTMSRRFNEIVGRYSEDLSWEQVVPIVKKWALAAVDGFMEYEATLDLWAEFEGHRQLFSASSNNMPFTEVERQRVSAQIQEIKASITNTYELSADQLSEVNERLDQIEEAGRRLGRKDWLMAFTGAVFSLILSDLIPPQAAQQILIQALHGLAHLFGYGGPPTPLP